MITKRFSTRAIALAVPIVILIGAASPAQAQSQGIKVHGHWTIDVRNPDGTLASHHEFENALVPLGAEALARLLGRFSVAGQWLIVLGNFGNLGAGSPCTPVPCTIAERGAETTDYFPTLVRNLGSPPVTLELSGRATALHATTIYRVRTRYILCPDPNVSPVVCFSGQPGASQWDLTDRRGLSIPVVPGQLIQVKVVLSFS